MIKQISKTNVVVAFSSPFWGRKQFLLCVFGLFIASTLVDVIRAHESDEYINFVDDDDDDTVNDNSGNVSTNASNDWDLLIFTQSWPVTTCFHWKQENKHHECNLPTKKEVWTIHGIWPTKLDTFGPNFCNNSAKFDIDKLYPIVDQMYLFWPNIENGTEYDSLWQHEWVKHGTCAAQLEELNDELKYFYQGLNWLSSVFMSDVLEKSGIYPDSNNTVISLHTAVVKALGKNPSIHCLYDNKKDVSYLSEIRVCFDKKLQLVDCDRIRFGQVSIDYPGGKVNTNCHVSKPIFYPSNVPPTEKLNRRRKDSWKFPFVNAYKLVQFLIWSTL
ncbi:ribonuclease Oy [Eupeodes corollae]|uniref:ribonuclease Oy n=1 Tax=Eupeodes corollae TaxID=290404 RepID=UPI00248FE4A5|nr:ribonuclease Oy [Eupeodes corollae]